MASVHRRVSPTGALSPYWSAKFRDASGRVMMKTTKEIDGRKALKIAQAWEKAARMAAAGELTQAASMELLDALMQETTGERFNTQGIEDFCREWMAGRKQVGKAASTLKRYRPVLYGFVEFLPQKRRSAPIATVTPSEVERFRDQELRHGKSAVTANFGVKVLRAVFNSARRRGLIPTNPAEAVELMPEDCEERIPFSEEQIRQLLRQANIEWMGMILLGLHAGLRLNDAANLTWENIDLVNRILSFRPQKTAGRKHGRERDTIIVLHPDLVNYLESLPVSDDPKAPIFSALYGKPSGSHGGLSNMFRRLMDKVGIRVPHGAVKTGKGRQFRALGYHSLRHSFVSRLANLEVLPDVRKQLAGHSSDEIHRRYVHLDLSLQAKAIEKLPSVLPKA
ncbi:MAG: tyrosine-type recombinase/integrase [Chthoniobacterales bacterium]